MKELTIHFLIIMISNMSEQNDWTDLLETPPEWKFAFNGNDKQASFTEEELMFVLQPSTFDFLNEDENENDSIKTQKKKLEELKKKEAEHGTYVIKVPGFVADSIKFEYVFGEVPSRCIMLSNVSPYATKEDLHFIFDSFGPYEKCDLSNLSKGVASVTFYNMEDAQTMRVSTIYLCNQQLMMVFHFENQSNDKKQPVNNGTIVVFRVPSDIDDKELYEIFSKFGKIRQIRNTPNKSSQKFIEYYDIRSAESALNRYNGKPLHKKSNARVSIEFSHSAFKKNIQKYYKNTLPTIERSKNNNKILY